MEALPTVATTARFMDPAVAGKFLGVAAAPINWAEQYDPEQYFGALIAGAERSRFNISQTAE